MTTPTTTRALERRRRRLQTQLDTARDLYRICWHCAEAAEAEGLDDLAAIARQQLQAAQFRIRVAELALVRLPPTRVRVVYVDQLTGAQTVALEVPPRGNA